MKNKSFTLIELLVVIVIIGILAGVIIVSTSSSIGKANFAKAQSFSNTVQNELLGDLVSEWTFNSPAVANVTEDSWGNNDGTLIGANGLPQLQTKENCVYGTCYLFDGVDDYISINKNLEDIQYDATITSWINWQDGNHNIKHIFVRNSSGEDALIQVRLENTKIRSKFNINGTSYTLLLGDVDKNNWHFIVVSRKGALISHFVDGSIIGTGAAAEGAIKNSQLGHKIGNAGWGNSEYFSGKIDDVRVYNTALSSAQVKQEYVAGLDSLLSKNLISKEEYNQRLETLAGIE